MSKQLTSLERELDAAKAALGATAAARKARGDAVKAATSSGRDRTYRSEVFSVRCRSDISEGLRKLAKAEGLSLAEWFEREAEAAIERGSR